MNNMILAKIMGNFLANDFIKLTTSSILNEVEKIC